MGGDLHTKAAKKDIDQYFSVISKFLSHTDALTIAELKSALEDACIGDSKNRYIPMVVELSIIPGWRDAMDVNVGNMTGQSVPHVFKLVHYIE